jgi:hypothetical protein
MQSAALHVIVVAVQLCAYIKSTLFVCNSAFSGLHALASVVVAPIACVADREEKKR